MSLYDKLLARKGLKRVSYHGIDVTVPMYDNESEAYVAKTIGNRLDKMLSCVDTIENSSNFSFDKKKEEIEALFPIANAIRNTADKCRMLDIDTFYSTLTSDGSKLVNVRKSDELLSICGAIQMMHSSFENHKVWDKESMTHTDEELWTEEEKKEVVIKASKLIYPGLVKDMKDYITFLTGNLEAYIKEHNISKNDKDLADIEKEG